MLYEAIYSNTADISDALNVTIVEISRGVVEGEEEEDTPPLAPELIIILIVAIIAFLAVLAVVCTVCTARLVNEKL